MDGMTQEEIDMLIANMQDENFAKAKEKELQKQKSGTTVEKQKRAKRENNLYKAIDFRKPNKLQYDNLGALKQIHEQLAKYMNNYLTMYLRSNIQVDVDFESIEQVTFKQYNNLDLKGILWGVFYAIDGESSQQEIKCFIQIETAFGNFFIDRSFGGSDDFNRDDVTDSKIADINKQIIKALFENLLVSYEQSWNNSNIGTHYMQLANIEDNPQNLSLGVASSEMMLLIPLKISIFKKSEEDDEDNIEVTLMKIGIPYSVIEPVLDKLSMSNILSSHISNEENNDIKGNIQKMQNDVDVFVGETSVNFADLLELANGDVIGFEKKPSEPFEMHIGGVKKYHGKPYKLGESLCIKIVK